MEGVGRRMAAVVVALVVVSVSAPGVAAKAPDDGHGRMDPPGRVKKETDPSLLPTPSPSPARQSQNRSPSPSPTARAAQPRLALTATAPPRVTAGEVVVVRVSVTNVGDEPTTPIDLRAALPEELSFRSSAPSPTQVSADGRLVTLALPALEPGGVDHASITVRAVRAVRAAIVRLVARSQATVSSYQVVARVVGQTPSIRELDVHTKTQSSVVQVGGLARYTTTITNVGERTLEDTVVVDRVAPELDIAGVPIPPRDEVAAVQYGKSPFGEDIVWVLQPLVAGDSVSLHWSGRAVKTGDFRARNRVTARAHGVRRLNETHDLYLGAVKAQRVTNPYFRPITKRRVITAVAPSGSGEGGTLPFTGANELRTIWVGLALTMVGALLAWAMARPSARRRRLLAILLSLALATTACVSGSGPDKPEAARSASPVKPKVKGKKVNRQNQQAKPKHKNPPTRSKQRPQPGSESAAPAPIVRALPQIPTHQATRTVTRVKTITVTAADLPVIALGPTEGDNSLSYEWDEPSTSIVSAASSRRLVRGARVELLTELSSEPGAIAVHVTLRNLTSDTRIAVHGRIAHDVVGDSGPVARFVSDSISSVLNPRGSTSVDFTYAVPTGHYTTSSAFEPEG